MPNYKTNPSGYEPRYVNAAKLKIFPGSFDFPYRFIFNDGGTRVLVVALDKSDYYLDLVPPAPAPENTRLRQRPRTSRLSAETRAIGNTLLSVISG
ncbi:MAG: hypothetical protein KDB22_29035, partial [Planctomycetales bacterium]|nr:hypothetical protein [Planctomycetales bacterium]